MNNTNLFFDYLNFKSNEPYLRDYDCMQAAKAYLEEKLAEKDFFRKAFTESDLTEVCYLIFQRSGGISSEDKLQLASSLEQSPSIDTISDFVKVFQEKIISDWCECIQETDPVTKVLRESVKNVLQYENFYLPVAAASYGHGVDEDIMFTLSVSSTLTEWPGQLPSFDTMLQAFRVVEAAEASKYFEKRILECLESAGTAIRHNTEPELDLDALFSELSNWVLNLFDDKTKEWMEITLHSKYEYRNFYYWLLSDMLFDALGIQQITSYYLHQAIQSDVVANALEQSKEAFRCSMKENQQWFEGWCKDEI